MQGGGERGSPEHPSCSFGVGNSHKPSNAQVNIMAVLHDKDTTEQVGGLFSIARYSVVCFTDVEYT